MNSNLSTNIRKKSLLVHEFGGKCQRCDESSLAALVFHHIDSSTKLFSIGQNYGKRMDELKEEASKCEILCRNCHKEEHSSGSVNVHGLRKIKALEYKKTNRCECCGYSKCNDSLDFHHIDSATKEFEFRRTRFSPYNDIPITVKKELDKCSVLCANCHAKQHAQYDIATVAKSTHYTRKNNKAPIEKILILKSSGMKASQICNALNLPKSTVSTVLKNNGVVSFSGVESEEILKLSDLSVNEILKLTGYCKASIYGVLRANGIAPKKKDMRRLKITTDELTHLRTKGKSFREIGEIYNVSWKTVRDRAISLGVYTPA
jgi:hypothetical protein